MHCARYAQAGIRRNFPETSAPRSIVRSDLPDLGPTDPQSSARPTATALVQHLQLAKQALDLMTAMTRLDKYRVLIIDDLGDVKKTDSETHVLFEFIAHRYESGSLVITSNQPFSQWDQIFPDALMTVAAIDRILHHATIIEIDGDSYRRKTQKKQLNK